MSAISLFIVSFVILILTITTVLPICEGKTNKHQSETEGRRKRISEANHPIERPKRVGTTEHRIQCSVSLPGCHLVYKTFIQYSYVLVS